MDIFKDAVEDSAAKLTKSFEKILIEVIILFMVIPRKINFTQMGRYGSHVEQTYRNAFGLKKSKSIDWLKLNVSLAKRFFGKQGRWAIAIDPSYISKAGKTISIYFSLFFFNGLATSLHLRYHAVYRRMIQELGSVPDMPLVAVVAFVGCYLPGIIWVVDLPLSNSLLCSFFIFVPHFLLED